MEEGKRYSFLTMLIPVVVIAIFAIAGYFVWQNYVPSNSNPQQIACTQEAKLCPDGSYVSRSGPNCEFTQCPATPAFKTYTDTHYGFEFQYPETLRTDFASFQETPRAIVSLQGSSSIDKDGCYVSTIENSPPQKSHITINGMNFCLSHSQGVGAGQLYHEYNYTTLKNGNYFTLHYVVHTSNGCSAYMGTPKYEGCQDFMNNYNSFVVEPIQQSVATFKFTGQTACNTTADCKSGESCVTKGPLVAGQPAQKVCVPPGQAVPL